MAPSYSPGMSVEQAAPSPITRTEQAPVASNEFIWSPGPERTDQRYGNLANQVLERFPGSYEKARQWLESGVHDSLHHFIDTYIHPTSYNNLRVRKLYGAKIIKSGIAMLQLGEIEGDTAQRSALEQLHQTVLRYHQNVEDAMRWYSNPGSQADAIVSGVVAEWSAIKGFEQGCAMPAYLSTASEDVGKAKVDAWIEAGQSDSVDFSDVPDLVWPLQVKSAAVSYPALISARSVEPYMQKLGLARSDEFIRTAQSLTYTEEQFDNTDAFLLLLPPFKMENLHPSDRAWYDDAGNPSAEFLVALKTQVMQISSGHKQGLTLDQIMEKGLGPTSAHTA